MALHITNMLRTGGLCVVDNRYAEQAFCYVARRMLDVELTRLYIWNRAGTIPEIAIGPQSELKFLAEPKLRKGLRNPDLVRIDKSSLGDARVMVFASLQEHTEALKTALNRRANALFIDGPEMQCPGFVDMATEATLTGHLIVLTCERLDAIKPFLAACELCQETLGMLMTQDEDVIVQILKVMARGA